jgi:hypothetical protein
MSFLKPVLYVISILDVMIGMSIAHARRSLSSLFAPARGPVTITPLFNTISTCTSSVIIKGRVDVRLTAMFLCLFALMADPFLGEMLKGVRKRESTKVKERKKGGREKEL